MIAVLLHKVLTTGRHARGRRHGAGMAVLRTMGCGPDIGKHSCRCRLRLSLASRTG